jgi:hypothetical protein
MWRVDLRRDDQIPKVNNGLTGKAKPTAYILLPLILAE